jgi:hypothetical protein
MRIPWQDGKPQTRLESPDDVSASGAVGDAAIRILARSCEAGAGPSKFGNKIATNPVAT